MRSQLRAAQRSALAAAVLAMLASACDSTSAAPGIASFTATPTSVPKGLASTLAWSVTGASSISIDNGVGDVTGKTSIPVTPGSTTTYQLKAVGQGATFSTASVTVTVTAAQPLPVISAFSASPPAVSAGNSSTLSWTVTNAVSLSIDHGVGDVSGLTSKSVTPGATTTYLLTATSPGGTATATATVALVAAGLRLDYADPTVTAGKKILLVKNAASTATHLVLDVKVGAADIAAAFGVAMNLPLDHTMATFSFDPTTSPTTGVVVPAAAPLQPGTGTGATMGGKQVTAGPLHDATASAPASDMVTIGVARKKSVVTDGDVLLPAGTVLFSVGFDVAAAAPSGTVLDPAAAAFAKAKLSVLKKDGTEAAGKSDFAIGQLFVTQ